MTEFELAQLQYMDYERQQGLIGLIQTQADLVSNDLTMWASGLFGYLVVAYFVGGSLTKVQVTILNCLYLAVATATQFAILTGGLVLSGFAAKYSEVSGYPPSMTTSPMFTLLGTGLNTACLVASLYFMWTVRHSRTE